MRRRNAVGHPFVGLFVAVGLVTGLPALFAAPAGASPAWSVQSSPSPRGSQNGNLSGVACASVTSCVAVGVDGTRVLTAQRWDGSSWSVVPMLAPAAATAATISGVACASATSCVAVGSSSSGSTTSTLVEQWDGTSWSIVSSPNASGASSSTLHGVSCASTTSCFAVGSASTASVTATLVEQWNGAAWSIVVSPSAPGASFNRLNGVSCPSLAICVAVGYSSTPTAMIPATLVEQWDGTAWSIATTAAPNGFLQGVSCPSPTSCFAVGNQGGAALAEQWDGTTWSIDATPIPGPTSIAFYDMLGVSCVSATSCFAVGAIQAFGHSAHNVALQHWDGASWSDDSTPNPEFSSLSGVSCPSATSCFAVGGGFAASVVDRWNGTSWSIDPGPSGSSQSELTLVACASATSCLAIGNDFSDYDVITGHGKGLAERWNGSRWSIIPRPVRPTGATPSINGVSCPTPTGCFAVGSYSTGSTAKPLIEHWNGTRWSIVRGPALGGASGSLAGVSCVSATSCFAVGYIYRNGSVTKPLIERWNGTRWAIVPGPTPTGNSMLNGASCVSTTSCFAVGSHQPGSVSKTVVEQWNGTRWSIVPSPNPGGGAQETVLTGVACARPTRCAAVGSYEIGSTGKSLAEQWNGTRWAIVVVPKPSGATTNFLNGVSCPTATRCVAVGTYQVGQVSKPFVEQWNGTRWSKVAIPSAAGAISATLNSVACRSATRCFAVGSYTTSTSQNTLVGRYG